MVSEVWIYIPFLFWERFCVLGEGRNNTYWQVDQYLLNGERNRIFIVKSIIFFKQKNTKACLVSSSSFFTHAIISRAFNLIVHSYWWSAIKACLACAALYTGIIII